MLIFVSALLPVAFSAILPRQGDFYHGGDPPSNCTAFQGDSTTNPTCELFPGDFADPCIFHHNGTYYAYGTNNWNIGQNVPVASSKDFKTGWKNLNLTNVLPDTGVWTYKDSTGNASVWDPDVNFIDGKFVMYYAATTLNFTEGLHGHCIGYALSDSPLGPYTPATEPMLCPSGHPLDTGGVIATSGFQHKGKNYMVYKLGPKHELVGKPHVSKLLLVELDKTGTKVIKGPKTLYTGKVEEFDAEGPAMSVSPDGIFFLWYVIGFWQWPTYGIRYVTSTTDSIWGPYEQNGTDFMMTGYTNGVYILSPGGPDFVNSTHLTIMGTTPTNSTCGAKQPLVRHPHALEIEYKGREAFVKT